MARLPRAVRRGAARVPARLLAWPAGCLALCAGAADARAQLRPDQVLVLYDSRVTDSLLVAEHYAGSAKVPGGLGNVAGTRPGVRVLDLKTISPAPTLPPPAGPDWTYTDFVNNYRTPLRSWLSTQQLTTRVRVLVTTRGMPYRLRDTEDGASTRIGDDPVAASNEFSTGDATFAALDGELALLQQNLNSGENGNPGDSRADGAILNPYFKSLASIQTFSNASIATQKTFTNIYSPGGVTWVTSGTGATQLTPGDLYLVCRLDGLSVQAVRDMLDRSARVYLRTQTDAVVLDESRSNGTADAGASGEFDNQGDGNFRGNDDFEETRDLIFGRAAFGATPVPPQSPGVSGLPAVVGDLRFSAGNVFYNALTNVEQFLAGPRVAWGSPLPQIVSAPVFLLAHEGANHGSPGGTLPVNPWRYVQSFNLADGAAMVSIESYNARCFGGHVPLFGQGSLAEFLNAGGCFGVGNVYEPLAISTPDVHWILRNFYLGNLTWAEAAYTTFPVLSWQQLVVGDPLARVERSSEDLDGDGRVGVDDLYAFNRAPVDINGRNGVDAADRRIIEDAVRWGEPNATQHPQR